MVFYINTTIGFVILHDNLTVEFTPDVNMATAHERERDADWNVEKLLRHGRISDYVILARFEE